MGRRSVIVFPGATFGSSGDTVLLPAASLGAPCFCSSLPWAAGNWAGNLELDPGNIGSACLCGLFYCCNCSDHFLEDHLWNHVVKDHVPKVFYWTFGTLLLMSILVDSLHLEGWIQNNQPIILLIACLVGLIPESGPHLLFLTLFVEGTIPFSIFLASSIVQDGHGMLPLLAESRRDFLQVKAINFVVGILTGLPDIRLDGE